MLRNGHLAPPEGAPISINPITSLYMPLCIVGNAEIEPLHTIFGPCVIFRKFLKPFGFQKKISLKKKTVTSHTRKVQSSFFMYRTSFWRRAIHTGNFKFRCEWRCALSNHSGTQSCYDLLWRKVRRTSNFSASKENILFIHFQ